MSVDRKEGRRTNHRAFRPTLDGGLESRFLLSNLPGTVFLRNPKPGVAFKFNQPPFRSGTHAHPFPVTIRKPGTPAATEVAHGGQTVIVSAAGRGQFSIQLTYYNQPTPTGATATTQSPIQGQTPGSPPIQPQGTVRAYAMPGGKVGIIVDGSTSQTELTISPYAKFQRKGYAHSFSYGQTNNQNNRVLNVGQITINSGQIAAIEGYHSADLSGPLDINGTTAVDRIAFDALLPGASIHTGGDLNTLDVLKGVNLDSGPGIRIDRDLNLINVGQDLNLSGGASLFVGRFLGTTPQPPKGTANGSNFLSLNQSLVGSGTSTIVPSLAGFIQGNFNLGTNSSFTVVNGISNSTVTGTGTAAPSVVLVNGSVTASSPGQIAIPNLVPFNQIVPGANFVARKGFIINGASFIPLTANLVSAATTTNTSADFTGTANPGATITYTNSINNGLSTTATANNLGNYTITVPLAVGVNVFTVTSTDVFGRPVTIQAPPVTRSIPLTANLVGAATTTNASADFTGIATPGATITYTDSLTNGGPTTTLAANTGNYRITVPLAVGMNVFTVTSSDGFAIQTPTVTRT